jgi:hypothetical protein
LIASAGVASAIWIGLTVPPGWNIEAFLPRRPQALAAIAAGFNSSEMSPVAAQALLVTRFPVTSAEESSNTPRIRQDAIIVLHLKCGARAAHGQALLYGRLLSE